MSRSARQKSATGLYHVMLRGADRRILFADDEDCLAFLRALKAARDRSHCAVYAYCLMGNHVHLLLREGEEALGQFMKRLGVAYVSYYNTKYELLGHLFQDRFRSEGIETDAYFLDVLRYICQNPVQAGLTKSIWDYRWLGCSEIKDASGILDSIREYTSLSADELRTFVAEPCQEIHLEDDGGKRLTDSEAIARLREAVNCSTVQEIGGWPENRKNEAIRVGLAAGISIRQLSRLTGIGKNIIERATKS